MRLTITQLLDHLVVVSAPDRRVGATVFHRDTVAQEAVKRAVVADEVMLRRGEGLTRLYHRFHRPDERHPDIEQLRDLHAALDRAVLTAYGWHDLDPRCDFLPVPGTTRLRLRWPQALADEVLARLTALAPTPPP